MHGVLCCTAHATRYVCLYYMYTKNHSSALLCMYDVFRAPNKLLYEYEVMSFTSEHITGRPNQYSYVLLLYVRYTSYMTYRQSPHNVW